MCDIVDDVERLGLTHVEFIFVGAALFEEFHECFDRERIVLRGYEKLELAGFFSRVALVDELCLLKDLPCIAQEFLAFGGQLDSLVRSHEDRDVVFGLEFPDGSREAGLGDEELLCGGRYVSFFCHGDYVLELFDGHGSCFLSIGVFLILLLDIDFIYG